MAGPGRDTKYDAARAKRILRDLRGGNTRVCAAARAGITDRTLRTWLARGRAGEEPFASFLSAVKKAERDGEAGDVAAIKKASRKNWTAAAWRLERRWPESWSANRGELKAMREELAAVMAKLNSLGGGGDRGGQTTDPAGGAAG